MQQRKPEPPTFTRRGPLAPGKTLLAADHWAAAMRYPRELTDEAAASAAQAHVDRHGGDLESTVEAFTASAHAAAPRSGSVAS